MVLEAAICGGVPGGLEQRRCSALEQVVVDIQVTSSAQPLRLGTSLSLCQEHSSSLSSRGSFLLLFSSILMKVSLGKLSPDLGQASLLPEPCKPFRSALSK